MSLSPRFHFHLTGFGPFCGVEKNPSSDAIKKLREVIPSHFVSSHDSNSNSLPIITTTPKMTSVPVEDVLEVNDPNAATTIRTSVALFSTDIVDVHIDAVEGYFHDEIRRFQYSRELKDRQLRECQASGNMFSKNSRIGTDAAPLRCVSKVVDHEAAYRKHFESDTTSARRRRERMERQTAPPPLWHIYIHIGVHGGANDVLVEEHAYNNATFRCPDEAGNTPQNEPIRQDAAFDHVLSTTLPMQPILSEMYMHPTHHARVEDLKASPFYPEYRLVPSNNPGGFICNYMYYSSLHFCNVLLSNHTTFCRTNRFASLFLHIPPANVMDCDQVVNSIIELMQSLVHYITLATFDAADKYQQRLEARAAAAAAAAAAGVRVSTPTTRSPSPQSSSSSTSTSTPQPVEDEIPDQFIGLMTLPRNFKQVADSISADIDAFLPK